MKKLLLLLLLTLSSLQATQLSSYINDRFGFSAKYPSNLFSDKWYATNGDGLTLSNKSKGLEVRLYGALAVSNNTIRGEYRSHIGYMLDDENIEITYKIAKRNWFVLSGYDYSKRVIFYQKTYLVDSSEGDSIFITYRIEYPIKDKKRYNYLVKLINKHFRAF